MFHTIQVTVVSAVFYVLRSIGDTGHMIEFSIVTDMLTVTIEMINNCAIK